MDARYKELLANLKTSTTGDKVIIDHVELRVFLYNVNELITTVKAEAGLVGYFRGTDDAWRDLTGGPSPEQMTAHRADQYADKIRNAGTWLRDENVNGGKRQGGE